MVNAAKYYIQYVLVKNFYDLINGGPIFNSPKNLKQRTPELQNLMRLIYQTYASYWLLDEVQSFYETMPPGNEYLKYFFAGKRSKIEDLLETLKKNLLTVGMASKDITDGFDISDEQLLSVMARSGIKTQEELYSEILRVVRLNPINKNPVPKGFNRHIRPLL